VGRSATTKFVVLDLPPGHVHVTSRQDYSSAYIAQSGITTFTHIPQHASSVVISVSCSLPHRASAVLIIHWLAPWTLFWASLLVYSRITSTRQILGRHQLQNKSWTRLCAGSLRDTRPTAHRDTRQGQVRTLIRIGRSYWPKPKKSDI